MTNEHNQPTPDDEGRTFDSADAQGAGGDADDAGGMVWDAVVVGGGAAGLSAALTLGRARRSVLVIDAGEPRNARAEGVHVFLTRDGTVPDELLRLGRLDAEKFGAVVRRGRVVSARRLPAASRASEPASAAHDDAEPTAAATDAAAPGAARFAVALDDATEVLARRLVITTGVVDTLPDVPGLGEHWGRGVIHCPYCHGWEVRDEAIGVLGTGDRAVFQALHFRQWSDRITLLLHDAPEPTDEEWEQLAARGIEVVAGQVVRVVPDAASGALAGVELESGRVVPLRALAVATRTEADATLLPSLGATVAEHPSGGGTYAVSDEFGPAAPGVWVAGNVANPMSQVITAAAAAVMAAVALNNDLMHDELAEALARRRAR